MGALDTGGHREEGRRALEQGSTPTYLAALSRALGQQDSQERAHTHPDLSFNLYDLESVHLTSLNLSFLICKNRDDCSLSMGFG